MNVHSDVPPKRLPKPGCFGKFQGPQAAAENDCQRCAWHRDCDPLGYRDLKS